MSFAEFHFLRPWCLLSLLVVGLFAYFSYKRPLNRSNWLDVCDADLLPYLLDEQPLAQGRTGLTLGCLAATLAIIAWAGPTWQHAPSPAFRNETALVIALDLSVSMDASDIKPSRIAKARYKIADLLKQRKDGQTALIVYGGGVFTVTPLTSDTATISSQLEALNTDIMPGSDRNTGEAIRKAVNLLQQAGVGQGDILLITDGVESSAINQAKQWLDRYRLSVLAVGSPEGAPISQAGGGFVKDAEGNILLARLDASALTELVHNTQGLFQLVSSDDQDVNRLQTYFDAKLAEDKNQQNNISLQQWDEAGPWLLLLVLPWAAWQFRKGLFVIFALCLYPFPKETQAMDWQNLWKNTNQRAEQAFQQQNYQQAAEQFSNPEWRAAAQYKAGEYKQAAETLKESQTANGLYNRGNALAKAGQLPEAIKSYQQALQLAPDHQDAQYNKELVEKELKKQEQQQKDQNKQASDQQNQPNDKQSEQKQNDSDSQSAKNDQAKPESANQDQQDQSKDKGKSDAQSQSEQAKQAEKDNQINSESVNAKPENSGADSDKDQQATSSSPMEKTPIQRANEQLLKRIPDEPTGLLKRKFKYQYNQQDKLGRSDSN